MSLPVASMILSGLTLTGTAPTNSMRSSEITTFPPGRTWLSPSNVITVPPRIRILPITHLAVTSLPLAGLKRETRIALAPPF
jgi:hypothetical protein